MRALLTAALLTLALTTSVSAQIVNGDFPVDMSGWTTAQSPGVSIYQYPPVGNPAPCVLYNAPPFNAVGFASMTQTFNCGGSGETGGCVIGFDYMLNVSSATVKIEAIVDAVVQYTLTRTTSTVGWVHVSFSVACGQHTLTIKTSCASAAAFGHWDLYADNVTGNCESPVPTAPSTWGMIKSMYR